jgi:hypothetical protein
MIGSFWLSTVQGSYVAWCLALVRIILINNTNPFYKQF